MSEPVVHEVEAPQPEPQSVPEPVAVYEPEEPRVEPKTVSEPVVHEVEAPQPEPQSVVEPVICEPAEPQAETQAVADSADSQRPSEAQPAELQNTVKKEVKKKKRRRKRLSKAFTIGMLLSTAIICAGAAFILIRLATSDKVPQELTDSPVSEISSDIAPDTSDEPATSPAEQPESAPENSDTSEQSASLSYYRPVLSDFYNNLITKWENFPYEQQVSGLYNLYEPAGAYSYLWSMSKSLSLSEIGYAFLDMNNDGFDELLISQVGDHPWGAGGGMIYELYSYKNGEIYHILSSGERVRFYLYENNEIAEEYANSAEDSGAIIWGMDHDSSMLYLDVENISYSREKVVPFTLTTFDQYVP